MRIHDRDTWRYKGFHVGSVRTGCLLSSEGRRHISRESPGGGVRKLINYRFWIPARAGAQRRDGTAGSRSFVVRAVGYKFGIFHLVRFSGCRRRTPVMKIPTLEFLLTLEIFAELCGCRRVDFFKNPESVTFISVCVLWRRECAPLWFICGPPFS